MQKCARECRKTDNGGSGGEVVYVNCLGVEFLRGGSERDGTLYIAVVFYSPTKSAQHAYLSRRQQGLSAWSRSS